MVLLFVRSLCNKTYIHIQRSYCLYDKFIKNLIEFHCLQKEELQFKVGSIDLKTRYDALRRIARCKGTPTQPYGYNELKQIIC